jgi:transcriptional regulator with XRE-family HTH domain
MAVETMTQERQERELLARVRSRQRLPLSEERRRIRERAGVSLRELARAIGVSHVAIARWEAGAEPANPEHVAAYGRILAELRRLAPEMREAGFPASDLSPTTNVDGDSTAA